MQPESADLPRRPQSAFAIIGPVVVLVEDRRAMIATRPDTVFPPSSEFARENARTSVKTAPGETFMTNGNGTPPEAAPPPQLNVLAQYTKDLSFENPNAPASLAPQQTQPAINIQINVSANNLTENEYEVTLSVEGKAENDGKLMFSFELSYAGVFRILNVPQENLHPLVMIECPRLLFPFAREIIATSVRDGGFPPLMLDPVDFVGLYRQNMERQAAAQAAAQAKPS
jgi:preprotein translocase subunit SecB